MAGAVERLTKLVRADERFAIPASELRATQIEAMFLARGREMNDLNRGQAMRPSRAECLRNDVGTAPGLHGKVDRGETPACHRHQWPPRRIGGLPPAMHEHQGGAVRVSVAPPIGNRSPRHCDLPALPRQAWGLRWAGAHRSHGPPVPVPSQPESHWQRSQSERLGAVHPK